MNVNVCFSPCVCPLRSNQRRRDDVKDTHDESAADRDVPLRLNKRNHYMFTSLLCAGSYHNMFVVIKQSVNNKAECLWDSVDFHTLVVKTVERSDYEGVAAPSPG